MMNFMKVSNAYRRKWRDIVIEIQRDKIMIT